MDTLPTGLAWFAAAVLRLGRWRAVQVAEVIELAALAFTVWRGWFAERRGR